MSNIQEYIVDIGLREVINEQGVKEELLMRDGAYYIEGKQFKNHKIKIEDSTGKITKQKRILFIGCQLKGDSVEVVGEKLKIQVEFHKTIMWNIAIENKLSGVILNKVVGENITLDIGSKKQEFGKKDNNVINITGSSLDSVRIKYKTKQGIYINNSKIHELNIQSKAENKQIKESRIVINSSTIEICILNKIDANKLRVLDGCITTISIQNHVNLGKSAIEISESKIGEINVDNYKGKDIGYKISGSTLNYMAIEYIDNTNFEIYNTNILCDSQEYYKRIFSKVNKISGYELEIIYNVIAKEYIISKYVNNSALNKYISRYTTKEEIAKGLGILLELGDISDDDYIKSIMVVNNI